MNRILLIALTLFFAMCGGLLTVRELLAQSSQQKKIVCENCEFENRWSQKFCTNCGVSLQSVKERLLNSAQKIETESLQTVAEKEQERSRRFRKAFSKPVVIPSLFNVPTADVLGSLDIFFNGGGAFGIEKERNFLGQAGLGLGDIAQVEFSTQSVINSLQRGTTSVPTSAFKMRVIRERENMPALAVSLRGTTSWQHLFGEVPEISFETRLTKLYIVASKRIRKVTTHFGVGLTDVRVRNPQGWTFLEAGANELQRNIWAPFGGLSIQANPKAMVMMEIEGLPSYQFESGEMNSDLDIKNIWAGVIGIRFYFVNWLVADAGVRYRSDFDGIADATIQANINVLLPLSRMRE